MVAKSKADMDNNKGVLRSKQAAALPTQEGLTWQYQSTGFFPFDFDFDVDVIGTWKDDITIVCDGSNKVTRIFSLPPPPALKHDNDNLQFEIAALNFHNP